MTRRRRERRAAEVDPRAVLEPAVNELEPTDPRRVAFWREFSVGGWKQRVRTGEVDEP